MESYALLVYTSSNYHDVLALFLSQVLRHCAGGASQWLPRIVILSDEDPFNCPYCAGNILFNSSVYSQNVSWFPYSENEPYWCHINHALSSDPLKAYQYVLFMQDDFLINGPFCFSTLLPLILEFDRIPGLSFVRTHPSGHDIYSYRNPYKHSRICVSYNDDYYLIHPLCSHPYSMQATLWHRKDLHDFLFAARQSKVWDEPSIAYAHAMVKLSMLGLASKRLLLPYVSTAVQKGKWSLSASMAEAYHSMGLESTQDILNIYNIDPRVRGYCD